MKDKIKAIREKCIEANPEIVELKFGCEVDRGAGSNVREFVVSFFDDKIALVRRLVFSPFEFLPFEVPKDLAESWDIIGRPIHLADVLLAIERVKPDHFSVGTEGDFRVRLPEAQQPSDGWKWVHGGWNLKDDDLEKQDEETINFIHSCSWGEVGL